MRLNPARIAMGAMLLAGACGDDPGRDQILNDEWTTLDGTTEDADDVERLDLGETPVGDCAADDGAGDEADNGFSYIWVANTKQNTISKIDTQTMTEVGRYRVRPDGAGNPSRTSVNTSGDVAVASRDGGVTKVIADPANCPDLNGDGVVTTSTGSDDVKAWGEDECVEWHTPFDYASQRPVAWAQGEWNPTTCRYDHPKLWTSGLGAQGVEVLLLDGDTGVVEQTVPIPGFVGEPGFGIYGAAVDGEGNFWGAPLGNGTLVFVDRQTFQHRTWTLPARSYGMTVDGDGYVWTCALTAGRFDPMTESWQTVQTGGTGGCMADAEGRLWVAASQVNAGAFTNPRLVAVDTQSVEVLGEISVPKYAHGVSIDFEGHVWGVTYMESEAYRVDPITLQIETVEGLDGPYTYSDMTGFALRHAGTNPLPPA